MSTSSRLVDRREPAVLVAPGQDRLRGDRPTSGSGIELLLGGGVEVDRGRPACQGRDSRGPRHRAARCLTTLLAVD